MVRVTRKFSRTPAHRKMMMRTLTTNILERGQVKTTVSKAKEARRHVDRMIALAKKNTQHSYIQARAFVTSKAAIERLYKEYAPRFQTRNGGYSRMLLAGFRTADKAPMAVIEVLREDHISVNYRKRRVQLAAKHGKLPIAAKPANTPVIPIMEASAAKPSVVVEPSEATTPQAAAQASKGAKKAAASTTAAKQ